MKLVFHVVIVSLYLTVTQSSIYTNLKDDVMTFIKRSFSNRDYGQPELDFKREKQKDEGRHNTDNSKSDFLRKLMAAKKLSHATQDVGPQKSKMQFVKDPVLNNMIQGRRAVKMIASESSLTDSSSMELDKWKDEWREHWLQKKFEAINSSEPRGDTVNMVQARPWGVPCGDPDQHDMPWGSCMLPMECEPEFRVYRGDYFCGRTQFVCCAIQATTYDLYEGFEPSFEDSHLLTDTEERLKRGRGSKERRKKNKEKDKKRRQRDRRRRKRKMKKNIKKIMREIKKLLSRTYRNGTSTRKKKTKELKKFIEHLKKQYKKDRKSVGNIHLDELEKIDANLKIRLGQLSHLNKQFVGNQTYRDIIVNGTAHRPKFKTYPELVGKVMARRLYENEPPVGRDDDIEYGILYY